MEITSLCVYALYTILSGINSIITIIKRDKRDNVGTNNIEGLSRNHWFHKKQ